MGYLPPVHNDQHVQYVNRTIRQKSNYANIQKTTSIPSERSYREIEKREENRTVNGRKIQEKKRKKSLNRRIDEKRKNGLHINESI
ncbi:hypothetical protein PJ311_05845 [Bacillus sp. CLL-7-23]|uniref:Uncharacterized protein n=1 Tax=Bacillus changyiensis TaxID=3004103 RepID=A0ABT4X1T9_9BACI|nr:hypothetical protein [Bacillus changyiensis]MDA7026138.1 hypothetical protein [Bacillus changyiensis]